MPNSLTDIIAPPSTIGIMGGGQLARMLTISAKQMGYRIAILEPDPTCPSHKFADYHIKTSYDDKEGLKELAKLSQVITTEFENVPANSIAYLQTMVRVAPNPNAINISQNRLSEKNFFRQNQIKTTQYVSIVDQQNCNDVQNHMFPGILKTNTLGYDGRGQILVKDRSELIKAFNDLNNVPCILESLVDLAYEVSIMVARNETEILCFPITQNHHKDGILDTSSTFTKLSDELVKQIQTYAKTIIQNLDYIGVLGIEFFITKNDEILCNEMAPRPHNSGHYSIDACVTSQFEQQLRSICNLKLGSTMLINNAIMLNLLGDIWIDRFTYPNFGKILAKYDNLKLHLYDKVEARAKRKMGHLVILGNNESILNDQLLTIKHELGIL